jgi:hypothetical protein
MCLDAASMARSKKILWGFDEEQRAVLVPAATQIPELRAVVERAQPHGEIPGLWVLRATIEELDLMYTLVEELTDATRSRRRIEVLDGLRMSLCTSMDGF